MERRGLGRGLSALMSDVPEAATGKDAPRAETVIPVDRIRPNPDQPRRSFTEAALEDLTASIKAKGILQPLILRPDPVTPEMFQIVAGERRWRAAQRAQLHEVPALIRDLGDTEVIEIAIIENIQRADLNPVEEAAGFQQLMERFGHTQEQLAAALGKSRSHIANLLRLLTLSPEILRQVEAGALSAGHARALITADDPAELAAMITKKGLSVRETERLAKKGSPARQAPPAPKGKDADTRRLEADLGAALGRSVSIETTTASTGKLVVRYESLADLDDLCRRLAGEPVDG